VSYTLSILINNRIKFDIYRILTETAWTELSDQGFTPHSSISSIAKAPGIMIAKVGDET
jgi:hypothetical protein